MKINTYNRAVTAVVLQGNHNSCNQSGQIAQLAEDIIRNGTFCDMTQ